MALDNTGSLLPVWGLREKITTIASHSSIIRTILVHKMQETEAQEILASLKPNQTIEIIAFETVKEVLEHVVLPNSNKTIIETLKRELQNKDPASFIDFFFFASSKEKDKFMDGNH